MTNDKPDFLQEAGPAAWRLAAQVVTAVGQVLLWIINAIGRLLRPLTSRLVATPLRPERAARLRRTSPPAGRCTHGRARPAPAPRTPPLLRWAHAWRRFGTSWWYGPVTGAVLALAALFELPLHHLPAVSLQGGFALAATVPLMFRRESLRPSAAIALGAFAASLLSGQTLLATTAFAALYTLFLLAQQLPRQSTGVLGVASVVGRGRGLPRPPAAWTTSPGRPRSSPSSPRSGWATPAVRSRRPRPAWTRSASATARR